MNFLGVEHNAIELEDDSAAATAAAMAAFAKSREAIAAELRSLGKDGGNRDTVAPMNKSRSKKAQRCKACAGCLRDDCGTCNHCRDMKKFGGPGNLRQACRLRQCMNMTSSGDVLNLGGGDALLMNSSLSAISDLHSSESLEEYNDALLKLTRVQLNLEVKWWETHLSLLSYPLRKKESDPIPLLVSPFIRSINTTTKKGNKKKNNKNNNSNSSSSSSSSSTTVLIEFHELSLSRRLDVVSAVCQYRKLIKRRRSNVAVIIVRIVFIGSFLFYCLLLNHSFQTNPNRVTNCFKLFSLLQFYNYIAPASLFDF